MDKYIIYQTKNTINGKIYIGRHKVPKNENRLYLGSGTAIINAIKKYGRENFERSTLFEFNNFKECREKEKSIITKEFVELDFNYNIMPGGGGNKEINVTSKKSNSVQIGINNDYKIYRNKSSLDNIYDPSIINSNGTKEWYVNGKRHRNDDLPAIEYFDGSYEWYVNGKLHRENNLPAVIYASGREEFWINGNFIQ